MTVKAYVLIQTELGKGHAVSKAIAKVPGVKRVHAVTGVYDVIAYLELPNMTSLSDVMIRKIQSVKNVERTHTAIAI